LVRKGAIVLKNDLLSELCGANDQNLKTFEDLLGVTVFSKGNEIFLETDDESIRHTFKKMITHLEDHVRLGGRTCPDYVRALYDTINGGNANEARLLKDKHVIVPRVNKRIFPHSFNQALYLDAIDRSEMVFGVGPAGTGKTYLAVACALKSVLSRSYRKLILTRPVVEAGENLGFLPGDLEQKINPYLRPLFDAMESILSFEMIREMEENRTIEIAPLAYMRGRSLVDSFVILDEAQNTTRQQMKMFLTRIGERSRVIITGDITQIDLVRKRDSGLLHVIDILSSIEEIRFVFFNESDVVRNPLVRKIVQAYEIQTETEEK
jgi:phosphate starvation-inducible PhoH-like protein